MKLIDKDRAIAGIESLKEQLVQGACASQKSMETNCKEEAYNEVLSILDDAEVKEVDFENELDRIWFSNKFGEYFNNDAVSFAHIRTICKHFFELGLSVSNKAEKEVEEYPYVGKTGKFTTTTK